MGPDYLNVKMHRTEKPGLLHVVESLPFEVKRVFWIDAIEGGPVTANGSLDAHAAGLGIG